jgi:endogenous inhibitor of DNA gyrase (YacG/DUF329 family)
MPATVKCPTCRRAVEWSSESLYRPFCSDRCRLIDLGAWFSEKHAIPGDEEAGMEGDSRPATPPDH